MIVIQPTGGLGNKLGVVFSYLKFARSENKELTVIWKKNEECEGFFLDYFQPIADVTFLTENLQDLELDYRGCYGHPIVNSWKEFIYSDLKLSSNIQIKVTEKLKLLGNFIGIQVRRTDHTTLALKNNSFTTDEEFCSFIESNPEGNLFITSDNKDSYDFFKNKYSDRVKIDYPSNNSTKLRHTSLEDAIIDIFVCIEATKIKRSGYSSFGGIICQFHSYNRGELPLRK